MKKLLTITATCLIVGAGVGSAQTSTKAPEIDSRTGLPLGHTIKSDLEQAAEKMVMNIKVALAAFKEVNKPLKKKLDEFDELINEISSANKLVEEDGELYTEIKGVLNAQMEKQKYYANKARDPET